MAKSAAQTRPLAIQAKQSYLHFIWGLSFGVVSVLATPFVVAAALGLGMYKTCHDTLIQMKQP